MSANYTEASPRLSNGSGFEPFTSRAINYVSSDMYGCFSHQLYDPKAVTALKNVTYKISMLGLVFLSPIEWVARSCLALIAYNFYLISTPIEWTVKAPFSLILNKDLPDTSFSRKSYSFAFELARNNKSGTSGIALNNFLFYRNNLTEGLVD